MKIAYTSDIHINSSRENSRIPRKIMEQLQNNQPDVFIITGDISHFLKNVDKTLAEFKELSCPRLLVPGNHDIWTEAEYPDSYTKYFEHLPGIAEKNGFIPVWIEPFFYDGYGFCGSMGWYDYSFKPEDLHLTDEDFEKKTYNDHTWMDKVYARFIHRDTLMSDREITHLLFTRFKKHSREMIKKTDKIIALFHHMPFKNMIRHRYVPEWNYFATYMGADCFGDFLLNNDGFICVIHGHYHRKQKETINRHGRSSSLIAASSPFGYFRTEGTHPVSRWYKNCLSFIEL